MKRQRLERVVIRVTGIGHKSRIVQRALPRGELPVSRFSGVDERSPAPRNAALRACQKSIQMGSRMRIVFAGYLVFQLCYLVGQLGNLQMLFRRKPRISLYAVGRKELQRVAA